MSLDDLIKNVVAEPPRTVMVETKVLAPGRREEANRRGGMVLSELLAGATRGEPRAVRYGHILGPPASPAALNAWSERLPHHTLPADLRALVVRVNGIHLWADLVEGRSYEGLAPLEEWELARVKMYGQTADPRLLADRYLAISYHTDAAAYIVLNIDSGRYFLMDSCGPDEKCPIGATVDDLLDWVWRHRMDPDA